MAAMNMTAYPAIDLRGGRVVQLVGGRPGTERFSHPDPLAMAEYWKRAGFRVLHVIDLDAALGVGSNREAVDAILRVPDVRVQVGGGVRDEETAAELLDAGASRVIVGTRAIQDPDWLERLVARYPARVVLAADVRGPALSDEVVIHGWTAGAGVSIGALLSRIVPLSLAAVLITDVGREGSMLGIDAFRFGALARATRHPLLASGGIKGMTDLHDLGRAGAAGAVLGMALYKGALDPIEVARAFPA